MEISPQEAQLVEELKDVCDQNGKETEGKKSAPIFHKLGLFYRKLSPDKISLIQSSVLLVAARIRQPDNEDFKKDLKELFAHVLDLAKSFKTNQNLEQITLDLAEKLKWMREEVEKSLAKLKVVPYAVADDELQKLYETKIRDIRAIQDKITESYIESMAYVSTKCLEVLGNPPCRYSLVGMGSLARKEISPYSDFEHVIVLEDKIKQNAQFEKMVEYFWWYTVIFQIILVNLGETIIPNVAISNLNDDTSPKDSTEILKNGYHLGDILTCVCFVSGDEELFREFSDGVQLSLYTNKISNVAEVMTQLKDDLKNFNTSLNLSGLHVTGTCNVKRVVYRSTTLFIAALGRICDVNKASCFDIIEALYERKVQSVGVPRHRSLRGRSEVHERSRKNDRNLKISKTKKKIELGLLANTLAGCHWRLKNYKLAYDICKRELLYYDDDWITHKDFRRSQCLFNTAKCALKLGFFDEAICSGQEALQIRTTMKSSASSICECRAVLGKSYEKQGSYAEAADQFSAELEMRKEFVSNGFSENDDAIKQAENNLKAIKGKIDRHKNCQII
ncbi:unnamed protein product [Clavelina lepadiformis]|uniref:Protein-PII uridylyltransferase N-terminal domain-containing protein n=1 Tax=Clavelina lepadiformis TaxID=159417 RepID=A0ABP0FGN8_CLALP